MQRARNVNPEPTCAPSEEKTKGEKKSPSTKKQREKSTKFTSKNLNTLTKATEASKPADKKQVAASKGKLLPLQPQKAEANSKARGKAVLDPACEKVTKTKPEKQPAAGTKRGSTSPSSCKDLSWGSKKAQAESNPLPTCVDAEADLKEEQQTNQEDQLTDTSIPAHTEHIQNTSELEIEQEEEEEEDMSVLNPLENKKSLEQTSIGETPLDSESYPNSETDLNISEKNCEQKESNLGSDICIPDKSLEPITAIHIMQKEPELLQSEVALCTEIADSGTHQKSNSSSLRSKQTPVPMDEEIQKEPELLKSEVALYTEIADSGLLQNEKGTHQQSNSVLLHPKQTPVPMEEEEPELLKSEVVLCTEIAGAGLLQNEKGTYQQSNSLLLHSKQTAVPMAEEPSDAPCMETDVKQSAKAAKKHNENTVTPIKPPSLPTKQPPRVSILRKEGPGVLPVKSLAEMVHADKKTLGRCWF